MFLTSCAYMLQPLLKVLKNHGIPFHNPYREANGFWNPLGFGKNGSMSTRVLSLLMGHSEAADVTRSWTNRDLALWTDWLGSNGVLEEGAKELLYSSEANHPVTAEYLGSIFQPGARRSLIAACQEGDRALLEWWRSRVRPEFRNRVQFPIEIVRRFGTTAVQHKPKVIVGTIHSVKGGQADVVYLFPDLSRAADAHYQRVGAWRDSVIRVFYVGATRARETLYICQRECALAITI